MFHYSQAPSIPPWGIGVIVFHDALHRQSGLRTLRKGWPAAVKRGIAGFRRRACRRDFASPYRRVSAAGAITRCPPVL